MRRALRCYAPVVAALIELPGEAVLGPLRRAVLAWYAAEHRDFPWRGIRDPYAVLVSEMMLQQTQAARVAERFPRFMAKFPTAQALADAPIADVLTEWSGLGYNRRAVNLRRAAAEVAARGWPDDVARLERLPGVGPYTARAIASLAFGQPVGVVDTNVRRWLLRRFGGADDRRRLQQLADGLAAPGRGASVASWTHASMELGAAVCRARLPRCGACPLAASCPSRDGAAHVPVPRQAALRGSDRAYRGAIVRTLAAEDGRAATERTLREAIAAQVGRIGEPLDDEGWERILGGLERDGLAHRASGFLALGEATIRT